ncbi:MAG: hypothetical protein OXH83_22140 [Bryobacterales bacterium]|nr:hypothetical protein [Bryobacterales bacterium]
MDYLQFYDLEEYLFSNVHRSFHADGCLNAFDLFLIVRWKSNRRKDRIIARLCESGDGDLHKGARCLTRQVHRASNHEERLGILMGPGVGLALATAILTVLYPEDFTVYDQRVCDALGDFSKLGNRSAPARIWEGYKEFREAVRENSPGHLMLRNKDRWLWAKNWVEELEREIDDACAEQRD